MPCTGRRGELPPSPLPVSFIKKLNLPSYMSLFNPFFDDFDSKFMPAVVSVIDSYCSFLEQDYVLLNEKIENGWLFPSYIEKIGVERTVNKCYANLVQLCTY